MMFAMDPFPRVLFLPGASGAGDFWLAVSDRLPATWTRKLLSWPGAGDQPHDPRIRGFEDLVSLAAADLKGGADLVAQSMGGVVAVGLAVRHPEKVRRLVLVATSGGIDVVALGGAEWRDEYRREFPRAAPWVLEERLDYTDSIASVSAPTLLIWGDSDPISPVAVGERLNEMLPNCTLRLVAGGTHTLALEHPDAVASLIVDHLSR
jgi:pimeloyl-ACP methyl ester carboxylesterase